MDVMEENVTTAALPNVSKRTCNITSWKEKRKKNEQFLTKQCIRNPKATLKIIP